MLHVSSVPPLSAPGSLGPGVVAEDITPRQLSITVEHSPLALERHRAAWEDLAAAAIEPNPFFEPYALLAAWRHLPASGLRTVLVWAPHAQANRPPVLVGLVPIVAAPRFRGLPLPVFRTWLHLYSYLSTPLVRAELASDVLEALLTWLRTQTDAALLEWRTIGSDGPFRHALTEALNRMGHDWYLERSYTRPMFRPASSADEYLAQALPGRRRKELRRLERRLGELGTLRYDELAPGGDLERWLDEFVALEGAGWKGQGGTALRCDPTALAAFRAMARGAFACGKWTTLALRLDGRPLAMKCCVGAGAGAIAYKIAYDETYARFSPGVLLELEHIRRLHRAGAPAWVDSGSAPDHPMLGRLWRDRRAIESLIVAMRPAGELLIAARPLLQWISRMLRSAVQGLHRA